MKSMIMKGWDKKLLITRTFKFNFQLVGLWANVATSLFIVIKGIEKQMEKDLNAYPTLPLSIIMEKCLEQFFILVQASTIDMNTRRFKMQKLVRRQVTT